MVSFDTERLRTGSNDKDTWQYNSAEDMKRCLISLTAYKNPREYYKCPIFSVEGGADPVWIEFDLKKDYLIDHVILYQYYLDKRSYNGQGVAVSKTGEFTEADTRWLLKRANDESGPATTNRVRALQLSCSLFRAPFCCALCLLLPSFPLLSMYLALVFVYLLSRVRCCRYCDGTHGCVLFRA